ncbi:hypothetical protein ILYODFUR_038158 [Ilyodon furcidens]|uniref:Uncharacterized protein n=1 Tax=Ilyodon furcidens TaxID=33524 RepID=A0ABV0UPB1_9TELE
MNAASITSTGATWSPSTVSVITGSMDSNAASPAPAKSHRSLTALSLCRAASEGGPRHISQSGAIAHYTQNYAQSCVFSSRSTSLMQAVKKYKRHCMDSVTVSVTEGNGNVAPGAPLPKQCQPSSDFTYTGVGQ